MKRFGFILLFAALFLPSCSGLKRPSTDPATMGSNALCYRAELTRNDPAQQAAFHQEIANRNLDCDAILANDPLMGEHRY